MLALREVVKLPLYTAALVASVKLPPPMTEQENDARNARFRREDPNVINLLDRLGYDIYDGDDLNRLRRNLEFCEELRRHSEEKNSHNMAWILGIFLTLLGAAGTAVGQWIASKFGSLH